MQIEEATNWRKNDLSAQRQARLDRLVELNLSYQALRIELMEIWYMYW